MTNLRLNLGLELPTPTVKRVRLRRLTDQDVPSLFAIFGDREVTRYWGHPMLPDLHAARRQLADIHRKSAEQRLFQWGVALLDTDAVVGTCSLTSLAIANRRAEFGFALARMYLGKGYMSEALATLLVFAFREMQLHWVWADTDPRNRSSIRVLERLGFRRDGLLRGHYLVQGEPQHAIVYGLLWSLGSIRIRRFPKVPNEAP